MKFTRLVPLVSELPQSYHTLRILQLIYSLQSLPLIPDTTCSLLFRPPQELQPLSHALTISYLATFQVI